MGNLQYTSASLTIAKAAGIIVLSAELARLGSDSDVAMRDDIERGLAEFLDQQFIDPTVAATNANPGSILNTAPSIGSAGTSSANALTDAKALLAAFFAANPDSTAAYWIMSPRSASAYAIAANSSTLTVQGGTFLGLPAVVSASAGARVAVVDAGQLLVADAGELTFDVARHATVEMRTDTSSPPTASTVMVNLWAHNLVGLKCERTINYKIKSSAAIYTVQNYV